MSPVKLNGGDLAAFLRCSMAISCLLVWCSTTISTSAGHQSAHVDKPARPIRSSIGEALQTWPTRQQELADEANDAQLLKAVQKSMRDWTRSHAKRVHDEQTEQRRLRRRRRRRATTVAAEQSVCYGDLGCFEDSGPFGYLDMLPSPPEEINTRFMFYSTKNRSDNPLFEIPYLNVSDAWRELKEQPETDGDAATASSASAPSNPKRWHALKTFPSLAQSSVRVIVHGFGSACPHVWIYELRTALMAVEDCVVICVDWENGANFPNYVRAAANTRLVGKQLAMFLGGLQDYKQLDLNRVHLIGFSLGAHVSGFAGAELPGISRITGLDPAGPLFESQHPKARLDSTDATFVDVIHSNGENLILGGLGSWQPMGHVDFYPNGGRVQHGCSNLFVGAVTDFIWSPAAAVEGRSLCNHRRAYKFFIDSIAPRCLFPAFPCDNYEDFLLGQCFPCETALQQQQQSSAADGPTTVSPNALIAASGAKCGNMGYYADRSNGRGQLYLVTREEEPFCAHQFTIEIHSPDNDLPLRTLGKLEAVLTGDGQLNETFSITEKDDTEFYAGERVSRILVPHPALGFPHAVTLRYKSYSGWLTKGLPQWNVHKVVLVDSFGARRSICRPDIALYSDRPVYLSLDAGDCVADESGDEADGNTEPAGHPTTTTEGYEANTVNGDYGATVETTETADGNIRDKKEIIELGKSYPIVAKAMPAKANVSKSFATWPVPTDNDNLIDAPVGKAQLKHEYNIKRYVKTGQSEPESGRSITNGDAADDPLRLQFGLRALHGQRSIVEEPVLRSTTLRGSPAMASSTQSPAAAEPMRPRENSVFTIQLFPFRLGELIERAERYARETLLPLISEQAPRIFRFGEPASTAATAADSMATGSRNARHLKYIPTISGGSGSPAAGAIPISDSVAMPAVPMMMRRQRRIDLPPAIGASVRIEPADFDSSAPITTGNSAETPLPDESRARPNLLRPISESSRSIVGSAELSRYYTANGPSDADGFAAVRIALPTYRPEPSTLAAGTEATAQPEAEAPAAASAPPRVMIVHAIPIPLSAEH